MRRARNVTARRKLGKPTRRKLGKPIQHALFAGLVRPLLVRLPCRKGMLGFLVRFQESFVVRTGGIPRRKHPDALGSTASIRCWVDPPVLDVYGPGTELLRFITTVRHIDQCKSQIAMQAQNLFS
jgi:hypothetical protein